MKENVMRLFLIVMFALVFEGLKAQVGLTGTIESLPPAGTSLIVEYFYEDSWKNLQSVAVAKDGTFEASIHPVQAGQYRVRLSIDPKKWSDFIFLPGKSAAEIHLDLDYKRMNGYPVLAANDAENKAYVALIDAYNQLTARRDSIGKFSMDYLRAEMEFTLHAKQLSQNFPGTMAADLLSKVLACPLLEGWDSGERSADSLWAEYARKGVDFVPFQDDRILYYSGFVRRLNYFFDYFYEHNCVPAYVDEVMSKSLLNDYVSAFAFRYVLDKMIDYRSEEGLSYLINWYGQDCTESALMQETTRNLLKALDRCKPGNSIEMMTLPDLTGQRISMQEVISKNELTIIMFWRSNCSHCREFEPVLKTMVEKYKAKGLGVYAINTDKMEADWRVRQAEMEVPWPSVFLAYDQRKDFNKRFPVPATPTLIAVDKNGVIVRRLIMRAKFEEVLNEMFAELSK